MVKTHYDNLQVTRTASPEVIRGAYKYLSQKWHPDKNPHNIRESEQVLKVINRAYEVLSNPQLRQEYDDWIARQEREEDGLPGVPPGSSNRATPGASKAKDRPAYYPHNVQNGHPSSRWFKIGVAIALLVVLSIAWLRQSFDSNDEWTSNNAINSPGPIVSSAAERAPDYEAESSASVLDPQEATGRTPKGVFSLRPVMLPELVAAFMVQAESRPEWSMGATHISPDIEWQSTGIETQNCAPYSSCRRGTARVTVSGHELENLRKRLEPVEWELIMGSHGPAKFGPEEITISPVCDTVSCEFDFVRGMAGSGIQLERLCHAGPGPFKQTAYKLTRESKRAIALISNSSGSGGASTDLTLYLSGGGDNMDWCADARAME